MKVVRLTLLALVASTSAACVSTRTVSVKLDVRGRLVVAHRGAHARAAENSLGSIREARRLGIDMVELDVRTTRDGALVLLHDESVDRTTDGEGAVSELDLAAVRNLSLLASDPAFAGERVPLLSEALDLTALGKPAIYLHVKEADPAVLARALVQVQPGRVLVFCEDRAWLERFHEAAPDRELLPLAQWAAPGELGRVFGARSIAFDDGDYASEAGKEVRALGARSIVDVLGSRNVEVRTLDVLADGAEAIQTDEPERVLAVLGR